MTQRRRTGSAAPWACFSFKCQTDRSDPIASPLFEPGLEPALSTAQREEMMAKNIRLLHVDWDQQTGSLRVVGLDGKLRTGP